MRQHQYFTTIFQWPNVPTRAAYLVRKLCERRRRGWSSSNQWWVCRLAIRSPVAGVIVVTPTTLQQHTAAPPCDRQRSKIPEVRKPGSRTAYQTHIGKGVFRRHFAVRERGKAATLMPYRNGARRCCSIDILGRRCGSLIVVVAAVLVPFVFKWKWRSSLRLR